MKRPTLLGLVSALSSFLLLQVSFFHPPWHKPVGLVSFFLGLLAICLGSYGIIRGLIRKTWYGIDVILFILDLFLGLLFAFYGFYVFYG